MQILVDNDGFIVASAPSTIDGSGLVGAIEVDDDKIPSDFTENQAFYKLIDGNIILDDDHKESVINSINTKNRISELKQLLSDTDYVVIKIAEGSATQDEYANVLTERQSWRDEINKLEGSL